MKLTTKIFAVTIGLVGYGFGMAGCSTSNNKNRPEMSVASEKSTSSNRSGAVLWTQNCGHCHNIRSPDSYSAAQWDVAMLHMRVRATLTVEEQKKILAFLKSAN